MGSINDIRSILISRSSPSTAMSLTELIDLIRWDVKVNHGFGVDHIRANLLLIQVRLEQYIYQKAAAHPNPFFKVFWFITRFLGSIYQWLLCNSQIPGSVVIGKGLRLPHPQNIIIRYHANIGEFCTIYHNVSIVWNGFNKPVPNSPKIGNRVLVGCGAIIIGDLEIGDDVLIGAGTVVPKSIPAQSRVTSQAPVVMPRSPSENAAEAGSERHLTDPYSIWR